MTELEQYKAMLTRAGIAFEVQPLGTPNASRWVIKVERGYYGFFCEHGFDEQGQLQEVGSYE